MTRRSGLVSFLPFLPLLLFVVNPVAGQEEERSVAHIYEAYYKINYGDLPEWNRQFETYGVPALEALRSEGIIEGWGHWQHNVGGEYNVRFAVRVYDWASIDTFWSEYLDRAFGDMPEEEQAAGGRMIEAHHDEIWNQGEMRWADDPGPTNFMYASTFNVNFDDLDEWGRIWNETAMPVLGQAMDAGVLNGVVRLSHNTGGSHNSKILYMFEDWDDIDDMWTMFFEMMERDHPEDFEAVNSLIQAHDDVIWSAAPGN